LYYVNQTKKLFINQPLRQNTLLCVPNKMNPTPTGVGLINSLFINQLLRQNTLLCVLNKMRPTPNGGGSH